MEAIQSAYSFFENLNLSVTSLIVIALVFSLAFLFSVREAATWFFKIDDLKKELKRLNVSALQIESELASLSGLLTQFRQSQPHLNWTPKDTDAPAPPQENATEKIVEPPARQSAGGAGATTEQSQQSSSSGGGFSIHH